MCRLSVVCTLLVLNVACTSKDERAAPTPTTPGDELPEPHAFLAPQQYDCTSVGPYEPPRWPHPDTCLQDKFCSGKFVVAHRMAGPFAPENTESALRAAILLGVDVVETDVRLTKDGRVVLIHDAEVNRTLTGIGDVESFTLAELEQMMVKPEPNDPKNADFSCERVLTLERAMDVAKGKIIVEFETKRLAAGIATAKYLRDHDLYAWAYVQGDAAEAQAIRAEVPDVPLMLRVNKPEDLNLIAPLKPILVEVDANADWLNPEVVGQVHAAGAKVFTNAFLNADVLALGSDDLSGYLKLYMQGADCVQTEFPHWALMALGRLSPKR